MIEEAKGYYIMLNPSQRLINQFISDGYIVYQNDKGEVIVNA